MNIAIIGSGNVGGALAQSWARKGHSIFLGVGNLESFKGKQLLELKGISAFPIQEAVRLSEVILLATPAPAAVTVVKSLGNTKGKTIIDAMNIVMNRGPEGYTTTAKAILDNTETRDVVKCFNFTGANNLGNPKYGTIALDAFVCGDSIKGKEIAKHLATDAGFEICYDIGGNDKFELMEQFALFWINLAMFQGQGREIGFKLLKR